MTSLTARAADAILRWRIKPKLAAAASLEEAAKILDLRAPTAPAPRGIRRETIGGVAGDWIAAAESPAATLLYLHGGAYIAGSPEQYRPITIDFARQGFDVFAPAYRLDPFPAPLEDARAVYAALLERGGPLVVAGDSAGGGLALALMLALRDAGARLPAAAALFSPWTDLSVSGASARENEERDALFTRRMLKVAARRYLGASSPKTPLASPLFADLAGLSPLLIHVSDAELLLDDARRLAAQARAAGVAVELEIWPDLPHCWQMAAAVMSEAQASLAKAGAFLRASL